jgi:hypothetical protein
MKFYSKTRGTWSFALRPRGTWSFNLRPRGTWSFTLRPRGTWSFTLRPRGTWSFNLRPRGTWSFTLRRRSRSTGDVGGSATFRPAVMFRLILQSVLHRFTQLNTLCNRCTKQCFIKRKYVMTSLKRTAFLVQRRLLTTSTRAIKRCPL